MLLLALANSPIRRLAMNSIVTKSRIIWFSERPQSGCINNSSVCSLVPVCQHRPVRYLLGISTSAINLTMPAAAVKVSYVLRIPPENMNHNAELSLEQQTTYYSYRLPDS